VEAELKYGVSVGLTVVSALAATRALVGAAGASSHSSYLPWVFLALVAGAVAALAWYFSALRRRILHGQTSVRQLHPTAVVFSCLCTPLLRANMDRQVPGTELHAAPRRGSTVTVAVDSAAWRFYSGRRPVPCYTILREVITGIDIADSTINDWRTAPVLALHVGSAEGPPAVIPVPVVGVGGWLAARLAPTQELRELTGRVARPDIDQTIS
jgi:hypothetical protein